jgi:hypothetical protein
LIITIFTFPEELPSGWLLRHFQESFFMIRFTSTNLRPALTMAGGCLRHLILEKDFGIFIRVPDDNNPGQWLRAYAAGCDPDHDEDWSIQADALIPQTSYSCLFCISQEVWDAVINDYHDVLMTPSGTTVLIETRPYEKVWVLVADFRNGIERLFDQAIRHYFACVGNDERAAWRVVSLHELDEVIRLDCKRAKPADHEHRPYQPGRP